MANAQTTQTRPRKTLDERIQAKQARFQKTTERIEKLGAPTSAVQIAELAYMEAQRDAIRVDIATLVASKDAPEMPPELKADINAIKKAIRVASKHNAPDYGKVFAQFLVGLEGMAPTAEREDPTVS